LCVSRPLEGTNNDRAQQMGEGGVDTRLTAGGVEIGRRVCGVQWGGGRQRVVVGVGVWWWCVGQVVAGGSGVCGAGRHGVPKRTTCRRPSVR